MNTDATSLPQLMVHAAWLRRFARALLRDGDDAEDLVQNTLVAAWQHPPTEPDRPRSWLARIAQNRAKDFRKAEARRQMREVTAVELAPETTAGPEQLLGDLQIHRTVAEVVTGLEEPFRETVLLRYYEGLSAAEIATRLKTPAGTIRWRLKEGLERVRSALDARCQGDRQRWTMALAPLLPAAAGSGSAAAGGAAGAAVGTGASVAGRSLRVAAVGALVVASAGLMTAALWPRTAAVATADRESADEPSPSAAVAPRAGASRPATGGGPRFSAAAASIGAPARGPGGEIPGEADRIVRHMLGAIAAGSYDEFLVYADDVMKAQLDKNTIAELSRQMAGPLERGFQLVPLGSLRREEYVSYLWKLDLGDSEDQHLIRLSIKDGRAVGIWFQ